MPDTERLSVADVLAWLRGYAALLQAEKEYLTALDSAIGDADHGINMDRGFQAVLGKLEGLSDPDIGTLFRTVGMTLVSTVGGAAGPLYGTFFLQLGGATAGRAEIGPADLLAALDAGLAGIVRLGKAEPGDKTMLDALLPARDALRGAIEAGLPVTEAVARAAAAAEEGMRATIPLVARKGRASYLGERSAGHQDPGATSSYLLFKAAVDAWTAGRSGEGR
ncbi:MAG TPA: dihydroxyacetone kinase subunit DhaL [Candidatus Binatia bacterium]|nr:dihydroxyacetone kinase subunit DhaL [Candidatus Binatia bacterium]